ncbi:hypothetical protein HOLDEFILI_04089 [Holdemania filiformis DSM 12042]|uniref:Uncharacterized protein n=1 Tax=Holdemania filiformis DSM 12042 TaxID=545696 RepID=B9YE15_9FIRM|nr:hypothetical protein HOLDEFILI_04089 [Holdemania filiformis DSM 12042]
MAFAFLLGCLLIQRTEINGSRPKWKTSNLKRKIKIQSLRSWNPLKPDQKRRKLVFPANFHRFQRIVPPISGNPVTIKEREG